jgi:multiple sugar transport system substrate-binding protein
LKQAQVLAVILGVASFVFVGCSGPKTNSIVLRWASWGDVAGPNILQAAVEGFKKDHPGVEVRLERTPFEDYISKLLTQYSAGLAPDVMAVNCDQMAAFASKGVLVDLMPYVYKDPSVKLGDYFPEAIDRYTVNGALAALPSDISPVAVIYYNKKKFDEAGLPYPRNDWTYTQFLTTAYKLTKKDAKGNTVQYGFVDEWPIWEAWVYAFGGQLVDNEKKPTRCTLDSPQAIAGIRFRTDLIHKYQVMPGPAFITAMGGIGNSDLFMNGTAALYHSGIWQTPAFRQIKNFDWDVVEFPKGPGGHRGFPIDGAGYAILKTSKHPELAYELVKYLAGEVGQKYVAATGLVQPAIRKIAESEVFLDGLKPKSKGFLAKDARYGHFEPFDPNVTEWTNMVASALDRVWNGTEPPEVVLKKITWEVNTKFFNKPNKNAQNSNP